MISTAHSFRIINNTDRIRDAILDDNGAAHVFSPIDITLIKNTTFANDYATSVYSIRYPLLFLFHDSRHKSLTIILDFRYELLLRIATMNANLWTALHLSLLIRFKFIARTL